VILPRVDTTASLAKLTPEQRSLYGAHGAMKRVRSMRALSNPFAVSSRIATSRGAMKSFSRFANCQMVILSASSDILG
jgi:hypothetical protein